MDGQEVVFLQQAMAHGTLGLLNEFHTAEDVIQTVRPLLSLYGLCFSLARREKWMTDYREQLRKNPIEGTSEVLIDNRLRCQQALVAIEGSMQALRAYAGDVAAKARERMWEKEQQSRDLERLFGANLVPNAPTHHDSG